MSNEAKAIFQSIANSDEFVETTALFLIMDQQNNENANYDVTRRSVHAQIRNVTNPKVGRSDRLSALLVD